MTPPKAGDFYLLSARESVTQACLGLDRVQAFLTAQTNDLRNWILDLSRHEVVRCVRRIRLQAVAGLPFILCRWVGAPVPSQGCRILRPVPAQNTCTDRSECVTTKVQRGLLSYDERRRGPLIAGPSRRLQITRLPN